MDNFEENLENEEINLEAGEVEEIRESIPIAEQETHIWMMRDEPFAKIYSSDTLMINKLDKLCKQEPEIWKKTSDYPEGNYICMDKKLVSFRSHRVTRNLTDEQRQELADRLRNSRKSREN